jgi:hypothetical protein
MSLRTADFKSAALPVRLTLQIGSLYIIYSFLRFRTIPGNNYPKRIDLINYA